MASHGLIQWTYISIVIEKVSIIFKSSTWGIDGNVRIEQAYLLSSIIVVKNSLKLLLLWSTKLANVPIHIKWMHFLYIQEPSLKFVIPIPYVNIFPNNGLKFGFPYKNSLNLLFFSF